MIKAYLPPEKSVYSLPRAAPGSPNHPARTSPSDGRPPCPYPPPKLPPGTSPHPPGTTPEPSCTHPREPALKPSLQPPAPETIPGTISETTVPGTDLQTPALPGPSANRGISRVPRPSAPGRGYSRARISTGSDKIMPDNAKFSHNHS